MNRDEATWEDFEVLKEVFPHLDLEGKVIFEGEGFDTICISDKANQQHVDTEMAVDGMEIECVEGNDASRDVISKRKRKILGWTRDFIMGK